MKRNKQTQAPSGDVRAFRAFEDFSGVSALVDVTVDGQRFTFAANFLGTESKLWLVPGQTGSRRSSKIAAAMAHRAFEYALQHETTHDYRKRTQLFYTEVAT